MIGSRFPLFPCALPSSLPHSLHDERFPRPVRPLLAAALAALLAAPRAGAASPCSNPPPDPAALRFILFSSQAAPLGLSLSPDSACPDPDLSAWLAWFRAQALPDAMLPDLSALPSTLSPSNSAYPVVARSPATLLRVADHLFDPASAVPPLFSLAPDFTDPPVLPAGSLPAQFHFEFSGANSHLSPNLKLILGAKEEGLFLGSISLDKRTSELITHG